MAEYWSYRAKLEFPHKMRDPIYGFIPMTDLELAVIDTPIFQRLRRIHQLALTKHVYPSAEHSRFVHSIGVMHCASLIYEGIFNHELTTRNDILAPSPEKLQILRLAALLHDVGHLPMSHAAEELLLPQGISHESISGYIIEQYPHIVELIRKAGIDESKEIAMLLTKTPRARMRLEHDIISGNLDADRADYLRRDSYACGVRYGRYDFERFLQMFAAILDENDHQYSLGVAGKDLWSAEALLIARYHYNLQVPFHRTRCGFDIALRQFISSLPEENRAFGIEIEENSIKKMDFSAFINFDDYSIFEKAKDSDSTWAGYLFRQNHLRTVFDSNSLNQGSDCYQNALDKLGQKGLVEDQDYFTQVQTVPILKGVEQQEETPEGVEPQEETPGGEPQPSYGGISLILQRGSAKKLMNIRDYSWIFAQFLKEPLTIYRIYATKEKEPCVRETIGETCCK
jgi:HD superfamily phosphohydrolase